ncbi:glycosyltransferase family 4 protein [Motilimonas sp. 1_MG-2023]|uniref:glycosyltransferase family 4 protein n=1 Tax=unclassified Motilimonas TaxID=2643697 RepID=UPI001E493F67|nr:glycosyltransferase family 4 protein [Motilimonas sp. 1_MG-2023]MCE0556172.1 glycosyltransferase family 4 protein [Motilimonas sp. E26]MDO6527205.1 glycosyltransferase family 4 protein [Motilimonas sp. 1_MG-2023]
MEKINLVVGTGINESGGIATVLNVFNDAGFFKKENVRLIQTHTNSKRFFGINKCALFLPALLKIIYYSIFFNVGLVHVHMSSRGSFTRKSIVISLAKALNNKVVLHLHGSEFQMFFENECSEPKKQKIRDTFSSCDRVVVLSKSWKKWVDTIVKDKSKVVTIYNSVPSLELSRDKVIPGTVLFLGRLGKRKGVYELIKASVGLRKRFPHYKLILGGDGDVELFKKYAEELGVTDCIQFVGWVAGRKKLELIETSQIFTLPSFNEGFPMGVIEAMSAGLAIVASTAGGIPDAITNEEDGLLIEAGDAAALEDSIAKLLADEDLSQKLGNRAKCKFNNHFSLDVILPQFSEIYSELSG